MGESCLLWSEDNAVDQVRILTRPEGLRAQNAVFGCDERRVLGNEISVLTGQEIFLEMGRGTKETVVQMQGHGWRALTRA